MSVRAKFKVIAIEETMGTSSDDKGNWGPVPKKTIKLQPVFADGPDNENEKFWDATPLGSIELGIINVAAAEGFVLGKEYYVDFIPAVAGE